MSGNNNAPANCSSSGFLGQLDCGSGIASEHTHETIKILATAIVGSFGSAGAQLLMFLLLRVKLTRIYRPRSYLVPERERVPIPPSGAFAWITPLFTMPNLAFIQKCGLDAYFFMRYLRLLLKIFLPVALVVLPILLPINRFSGNVEIGVDQLSISNIAPEYIKTRFWAHLILALCVIAWVMYVALSELRGYIRVRQAFLSSPQHRIRASATTVLVTGIPAKWLTVEALGGLYDVYPGGIRNIWINRNYDDLATKVSYRDDLAKSLESAETNLIRACWEKHEKMEKERLKGEGVGKKSKEQKKQEDAVADAAAEVMAEGDGVSAGDQQTTPRGLQDAMDDANTEERKKEDLLHRSHRPADARAIMEGGIGAVGAVGKGIGKFGRGVGNFGQRIVGDVDQGLDHANMAAGFVTDEAMYGSPDLSYGDAPTPPPKSPAVTDGLRVITNNGEGFGAGASIVKNPQANHPTAAAAMRTTGGTPTSDLTRISSSDRRGGTSIEAHAGPRTPFQIEVPPHHVDSKRPWWKFWQSHDNSVELLSPRPHTAEEDEFPLTATTVRHNTKSAAEQSTEEESSNSWVGKLMFWRSDPEKATEEPREHYPDAFAAEWDADQDGDAVWKRYITSKERETMRVPIFSPTWCPSLPLIGKKVDRIYWTRRELARLNMEIEADQNSPDKFPHMNSAFIQFNHQVAAHMACQSVSHHTPLQMAPRTVEISPDDVLWGNMSIKWWERYLRTLIVLIICVALIVLYAIPVSFTSALSKVGVLAQRYHWLAWLASLPEVVIDIIQGVLPAIILSIILILVPIIFRLLVKEQGVPTGTMREMYVQQWYFAFLFIQVFLVVTIVGGLTTFFSQVSKNPTQVLTLLARDLPSGADYFFSYLTVQAISNSASALLQIGSLIGWFVLAPLLDSTARAKWRRQTNLSSFRWGSFYPPFTNFAVIGIIYSVIAPLILFFMIVIFAVFWIVYRYNVLYVYQFRNDTGGLLFPTAINQLFTGLYVLELFLIGLFFTTEDQHHNIVCVPQGVIMVVALVGTAVYQILLNNAVAPLLRYLPITLEDEAVIRDEQFARAQASQFYPQQEDDDDRDGSDGVDDYKFSKDGEVVETSPELRKSSFANTASKNANFDLSHDYLSPNDAPHSRRVSVNSPTPATGRNPWHQRDDRRVSVMPSQGWKADRLRQAPNQAVSKMRNIARVTESAVKGRRETRRRVSAATATHDMEAQHTVGDVLYSGFADELEDLTPDERDLLVRYAFQHAALRAKRPVVWIPRDRLGVSDDEIRRAKKMSTVLVPASEEDDEVLEDDGNDAEEKAPRRKDMVEKTNIWMSNEGTALNSKGKVVFRRSPPDFSNVDLIAL